MGLVRGGEDPNYEWTTSLQRLLRVVRQQRLFSGSDPTNQVASPYAFPWSDFEWLANRRLPHVYEADDFDAFATAVDNDGHPKLLAARPFASSMPASENHPRSISVVSRTDSGDEQEYVFQYMHSLIHIFFNTYNF